ncbi:hypothetical protein LguiB_016591 [Lonicera macranthoides]
MQSIVHIFVRILGQYRSHLCAHPRTRRKPFVIFKEEENIRKRLEDYSPEEQNNLEVRNKIFEEVVGQDGHGWALCMGTGIRPAPKRARVSSSSDKNLEVEIAQIREEAEEERNRHKEELQQVFNKSKEYVNEMLRRAGLSIPDDVIDTSIQP